ncbi:hypothetical protein PIB30_048023 [Stylosanthes scabra]|uniref:Uncharacterized protein n=1 Tax=Stylosanthes scabra TaxID=79078 RepID=A0ABU6YFP1_9FABA|nr:hypothetical protein [Stylosanthes scabra]
MAWAKINDDAKMANMFCGLWLGGGDEAKREEMSGVSTAVDSALEWISATEGRKEWRGDRTKMVVRQRQGKAPLSNWRELEEEGNCQLRVWKKRRVYAGVQDDSEVDDEKHSLEEMSSHNKEEFKANYEISDQNKDFEEDGATVAMQKFELCIYKPTSFQYSTLYACFGT